MKNSYSKTGVIKVFLNLMFYSIKTCFSEISYWTLGLLHYLGIKIFKRRLKVLQQYRVYDEMVDEMSHELKVNKNPDKILELGFIMADLIEKGIEPEKNNVIAIYKEQNNG